MEQWNTLQKLKGMEQLPRNAEGQKAERRKAERHVMADGKVMTMEGENKAWKGEQRSAEGTGWKGPLTEGTGKDQMAEAAEGTRRWLMEGTGWLMADGRDLKGPDG